MKSPHIDPYKKIYTASLLLQIILFIFTVFFLLWLLNKPSHRFKSQDPYPFLVTLTPRNIIQFGGRPSTVSVGMYIRDLPDFNMVRGSFIGNLTIWFRFDPRLVSLNQIDQFKFDRAKVLNKSAPMTTIEGDALITKYNMRVQFNMNLNYHTFPLDDHKITIILTHPTLSPADIIFDSARSNFNIDPQIEITGWKLVDLGVQTGFVNYSLDPYKEKHDIYNPRIVFALDFVRTGMRHLISIVLPLILIFFIALFTLSLDPYGSSPGIITMLSVGAITGAIAHRFIMERMSPESGYLMISDYMFIFVLMLCCLLFVLSFFSIFIERLYKNILAIIITLILISSFLWFILPLI